MPKLTLGGPEGPGLKQEGLPGRASAQAGCPRGSLWRWEVEAGRPRSPHLLLSPSCRAPKADRSLLPDRPLAGKSLWAGSQAPGWESQLPVLAEPPSGQQEAPTDGRPTAPSSTPANPPIKQISLTPCRVPTNLRLHCFTTFKRAVFSKEKLKSC